MQRYHYIILAIAFVLFVMPINAIAASDVADPLHFMSSPWAEPFRENTPSILTIWLFDIYNFPSIYPFSTDGSNKVVYPGKFADPLEEFMPVPQIIFSGKSPFIERSWQRDPVIKYVG